MKDSRALVLGLTYKPDVTDNRSSKIKGVIEYLKEFDIPIAGYDPLGDRRAMADEFDIEIQQTPTYEGMDLVLLATAHDEFKNIDIH